MARDYAKEYREYHSKPEQKKNRAQRNAARDIMEKAGAVRKGDGKDVDHKRSIATGGGNSRSNLRAVPKGTNRGRGNNI